MVNAQISPRKTLPFLNKPTSTQTQNQKVFFLVWIGSEGIKGKEKDTHIWFIVLYVLFVIGDQKFNQSKINITTPIRFYHWCNIWQGQSNFFSSLNRTQHTIPTYQDLILSYSFVFLLMSPYHLIIRWYKTNQDKSRPRF